MEEHLDGGQSTKEVVRINDTVHRTQHTNSEFVHKVLSVLEQNNFQYSPRFLGIDDQNREIVTFIEGTIDKELEWTDELLKVAVSILRSFHDATEHTILTSDDKVICHRDFAPWNVVTRDKKIVGIIDFDDAELGLREEDLAYFLWTFLELGNEEISEDEQLRRITMCSNVYGDCDPQQLIEGFYSEQNRVLEMRKERSKLAISEDIRRFSAERIAVIKKEIE